MLASLIALIFAAQAIPPTLPALPSPTPIATVTSIPTLGAELPTAEVVDWLSTAVANINAMPEDASRPGGVPILPDQNQNYMLFNHAKWLLSLDSLNELLGVQVADMVRPFTYLILVIIITTSISVLFRVGIFAVRGVIWVIQNVMRFVPFLGAFAYIQMPTPTPMPLAPPPVLNVPQTDLWDFADDAVAWWGRLGSGPTQTIQIIIILMLIVVGVVYAMKIWRDLGKDQYAGTPDPGDE